LIFNPFRVVNAGLLWVLIFNPFRVVNAGLLWVLIFKSFRESLFGSNYLEA
jgi:hypothetical protein